MRLTSENGFAKCIRLCVWCYFPKCLRIMRVVYHKKCVWENRKRNRYSKLAQVRRPKWDMLTSRRKYYKQWNENKIHKRPNRWMNRTEKKTRLKTKTINHIEFHKAKLIRKYFFVGEVANLCRNGNEKSYSILNTQNTITANGKPRLTTKTSKTLNLASMCARLAVFFFWKIRFVCCARMNYYLLMFVYVK